MRTRTIEYFRLDSRPMPHGVDLDAQIAYGSSAESRDVIVQSIKHYGTKRMAEAARISERQIRNIYHGKVAPPEKLLTKLLRATAAPRGGGFFGGKEIYSEPSVSVCLYSSELKVR